MIKRIDFSKRSIQILIILSPKVAIDANTSCARSATVETEVAIRRTVTQ